MISDQFSVKNQNVETKDVIQNIIIENRNKMSISGVNDVLSFDDQIVILETQLGMLTVKGDDLRISKLNIDTTEVIIDGNINSINYSDKQEKKGNIIGKIFK